MTENRNQFKKLFSEIWISNLETKENIWRGWIVPVGGSTPDRLRPQTGSKSRPFPSIFTPSHPFPPQKYFHSSEKNCRIPPDFR